MGWKLWGSINLWWNVLGRMGNPTFFLLFRVRASISMPGFSKKLSFRSINQFLFMLSLIVFQYGNLRCFGHYSKLFLSYISSPPFTYCVSRWRHLVSFIVPFVAFCSCVQTTRVLVANGCSWCYTSTHSVTTEDDWLFILGYFIHNLIFRRSLRNNYNHKTLKKVF